MIERILAWAEDNRGLFLVLCLSAAIKTVIWITSQVINPDGVIYLSAAREFASGRLAEGLALHPMPAFSLLISSVHLVIPHWIGAARFVSVVTSVFVLIPMYIMSRDMFDRKAAFWGCLAFALAPFPNGCSVEVIRGPAYLFLFAWAVCLSQRALRSHGLGLYLSAALFAWASALLRIEALLLFPLFIIFLACLVFWSRQESGKAFKGIITWISIPCFLALVLMLVPGPNGTPLLTAEKAVSLIKGILELRFLDNYGQIYEQLAALEAASKYPAGKQNFLEITRHFMPFIYGLGILETFIKVLFPLFLLPLILGFSISRRRSRIFILVVVIAYLALVYLSLVKRDFIQSRFLFAPAFLLYPWIGAGMDRMISIIRRTSHAGLLGVLFILIFMVSPGYISVRHIFEQDNVIPEAGKWLAERPILYNAKMVTTDARIPFYAGKETGYETFSRWAQDHDAVERFAITEEAGIILIRTSVKSESIVPAFKHFKRIKEFKGKKNIAVIYGSPDLLRNEKPERRAD